MSFSKEDRACIQRILFILERELTTYWCTEHVKSHINGHINGTSAIICRLDDNHLLFTTSRGCVLLNKTFVIERYNIWLTDILPVQQMLEYLPIADTFPMWHESPIFTM